MPTGEFKQLLDRDFTKASIQPITDITTPLLRELVDASLRAFKRCEMEAADHGKENEDVAALVLFRHIIEMADGVEVHIANGCGTATIPVIRSQFEASASLAYLLNDDAKYVERSLSWLVTYMHSATGARETLEPGTLKGKKYEAIYAKEFGRAISGTPNTAIAAEIAALQAGLQTPQFAPIQAEYQRTKKHPGHFPEWFSLFNGPKSRKELAEVVGYGAFYHLLYGDWSGVGHANDVRRFLSVVNGRPAFDAVRRPDELQQIALQSALLLMRAHHEMIKKFRNGENVEGWYVREIRPLVTKLSELQVEFKPMIE
jgi:hypothetical protein